MKTKKYRKIQRNEPCPCNSGKKYKKCCIDSGMYPGNKLLVESEPTVLYQRYNQTDFLATIGGLHLVPENHGKYVRLESIARKIILAQSKSPSMLSRLETQKIFSRNFVFDMYEDPPESLFTETVPYFPGETVVYPGPIPNEANSLSNLLTAVNHIENSISQPIRDRIWERSKLLLGISSIIAKRMGHVRNLGFNSTEEDNIHIPSQEQFSAAKAAVSFRVSELESFCRQAGISFDSLEDFLISSGDSGLANEDREFNPILARPLFRDGERVIVIAPSSLCHALVCYIWRIARENNETTLLANAYLAHLWRATSENLIRMKFIPLGNPLFEKENLHFGRSMICKIDDDKVALIRLSLKMGEENMDAVIKEGIPPANLAPFFNATHQDAVSVLSNAYAGDKSVVTDIIASDGLWGGFLSKKPIPNSLQLVVFYEDFEIILLGGKLDKLLLWKFAQARNQLRRPGEQPAFATVLNDFAYYREHNQSFYLGDDVLPDTFPLFGGLGYDLIAEIKRQMDFHSAKFYNFESSIPGFLPVRKVDSIIPMYAVEGNLGENIAVMLGSFSSQVWIQPTRATSSITGNLRATYYEFTQAICYWCWQLFLKMEDIVLRFQGKPLSIFFDFDNPKNFKNNSDSENRPSDLYALFKFNTKVAPPCIELIIPSSIQYFMALRNNEGERVLCKIILEAIGTLEQKVSGTQTLNKDRIEEVLEEAAPLGHKKKLNLVFLERYPLLNNQNIPQYRYVQEYDEQVAIDRISKHLATFNLAVGEVEGREAKVNLCTQIIDFLFQEIGVLVTSLDHHKLLTKLIGQYEAIVQWREWLYVQNPTRIACFAGFDNHIIDSAEIQLKLDKTGISLRCLVEFISAQTSTGDQIPSLSTQDELLALMSLVVSWGQIREHIKMKLFDHQLSILPSGRVGQEKKYTQSVFDPFRAVKLKETFHSSEGVFDLLFRDPSDELPKGQLEITDSINAAFQEEHGLTFYEMRDFLSAVSRIGFALQVSAPTISENEFIEKILEDSDLSRGIIEVGIDIFSMSAREDFFSPLEDFVKTDVLPWRFNRALSYLQRPLIKSYSSKNELMITWGPRNTHYALIRLVNSLFTGKIRGKSPLMKSLIGKIGDEKGKIFTAKVQKWMIENTALMVKSDVDIPIRNKKKLFNLGDVDILAVDQIKKIVYSIECKNTTAGRNAKEMADEVENCFGSATKKGWISRHLERNVYLNGNFEILSSMVGMDISEYELVSFILTATQIPTTFIKSAELGLPVLAFTEFERIGISAIESLE